VLGYSNEIPGMSLTGNDLGVAVSYTNKYSTSGSSIGVWLELIHVAPDTLAGVRYETLKAGENYQHTAISSGVLSLLTDTTGTALIVRGRKDGLLPGEIGSGPYYTATYPNFFTSTTPPTITASAVAQDNPWAVTGALTLPREKHTTTLLDSTGELLVVSNDTAELYNPSVHQSRPTGKPLFRRLTHTATWLQASGKVLVTGGLVDGVLQASAESYDAATGTWALAAPMRRPRAYHTATVLQSGKVLVVGGYSTNGTDTNTAELYDPEKNTWKQAGDVYLPRNAHSATLLQSGKVLVMGGNSEFSRTSHPQDVQLYDPATNTWTAMGAMPRGRFSPLALQLNSGSVMVLGGKDEVDLYDPYNNRWTQGPWLPYGAQAATMTLMSSGKVLVTHSNGQASLYDPATNAWSSAGFLAFAVHHYTATPLRTGEVLVVGGSRSSSATQTVQWYKP
jgi:hypothetical protein